MKGIINNGRGVRISTQNENAHVTLAGPEAQPTIDVEASGMFEGVWLTARAFNVIHWQQASTSILLNPEDAMELALALIRSAQQAKGRGQKV